VSRYQFIAAERHQWPVTRMCHVLEVSVSGFYAWMKRTPSRRTTEDTRLSVKIVAVYEASRQTYGYPRVHAALHNDGERVSRRRVARLMRQLKLEGIRTRRYRPGRKAKRAAPEPNRLDQQFTAERLNEKWLVDFTYIPTHEGWLYLACVLDVCSRRIVGWAMDERATSELVCRALTLAIGQRGTLPELHHSDQGSQYTSRDYLARLNGVVLSMSGTGSCYDNAMKEAFFNTLKTECVIERFPTRAIARQTIFDYIECFYNPKRLHSALDYMSPAEFERQRAA
jgi:putative transposase